MLEQYRKAVLSDYQKKKNEHKLSLNLLNPAPARLRDECLKAHTESTSPNIDEDILKLFFGSKNGADNYVQIIRSFDPDKFRPLVNFLKGITNDPEDKNVELLAWLINFESRPFHVWSFKKKEGTKRLAQQEEGTGDNPEIEKPISPIKKKIQLKIVVGIAFFLVLIASIIYSFPLTSITGNKTASNDTALVEETKKIPVLFVNNNKQRSPKKENSKKPTKDCMYWFNDHYEAIFCNKDIGDTAKFVMNEERVAHFKKINEPDTLTQNSIGKVYYIKINGTIEYYTTEGFHPIHTDKKLKRLSAYMLNKYILSKR